ncbi:hypothetical protein ACOME3_000778 [Neoechinorhynchus agilis]
MFFLIFVTIAIPSNTKRLPVTYGSSVKLYNPYYKVRLHSHEIAYGTGSGQQSVTAVETEDDHGSYWQILAQAGNYTHRGQSVQCRDVIRLLHCSTRKFLHTHHFQSPLSRLQEVSAFGDNEVGDHLDNWKVECSSKGEWEKDSEVRFIHEHGKTGAGSLWLRFYTIETNVYLHLSGQRYGGHISRQMEVVGTQGKNRGNGWKVAECVMMAHRATDVTKDEL